MIIFSSSEGALPYLEEVWKILQSLGLNREPIFSEEKRPATIFFGALKNLHPDLHSANSK
jgi:hypothetical protein